ncbi:MAG: SRPBCC family protein [Flavobacteriales bacterium]|nr:SRPBCC family protein [Flavobacteriales bacterium]
MKILKYTVIALALLFVVFIIWLASIDGSYDTSRTRVVDAPSKVVYSYVNDFKQWPEWSPWEERFDGNMKKTYSGSESGVGAKYSWTGEESGDGGMEIVSVNPYSSIDQLIFFKSPWEMKSNIYWKFDEFEGGTKVTWGMKGEMSFFFKFMANGIDAAMEKDLLRGLEKLDSVSVVRAKAFK